MAKRTVLLLVVLIVLAAVAAICIMLALRERGLTGTGVYFLLCGGMV